MRRIILAFLITVFVAGCSLNPMQGYGNPGGTRRGDSPKDPPFDANAIDLGARWFPTHLRFSPDDNNFLASLCHVRRPDFCRIGRYTLATKTWDILPFEPLRTYRWPTYSPDGKWIVTTTAPCDEKYLCEPGEHVLVKMRPDGAGVEKVGNSVLAQHATFSGNGKKLIYWKYFAVPTPKGLRMLGKKEIYSMDFQSGEETALTEMNFRGEEQNTRPMLTPDGETVILSGHLFSEAIRHIGTNAIERPPEITRGENHEVRRWMFNVKDAPMNRKKAHEGKLRPIFPGQWTGMNNDMTLDGAILYSQGISTRRAADSIPARTLECRQSVGLTVGDFAVFLQKITDGAQDEAGFCIGGSSFTSVSNNKKWLVFLNTGAESMHGRLSIFMAEAGAKEQTRIDWPRIDLK